MNTLSLTTRGGRGGFAGLLALMLLAALIALAAAMAVGANLTVQTGNNQERVLEARLAAEGGLSFMLERLRAIRLPNGTTESNLAANLAQKLGETLNGTTNLAGGTVTCAGGVVSVPAIALEGGTFTCRIVQTGADRCRLEVLGSRDGLDRRVAIDLVLSAVSSRAFDYGLASRGQVVLSGSASIVGVNTPAEASVLSATTTRSDAITITGGVTVSGDLSVAGTGTQVIITGTPSIAGSSNPATYPDHVHYGVEAPDFPEVNTASLAALATNVVTAATNVRTPGQTWTNIRIAAGANPNFANNQIINGIIYIEAPNIVRFEGQVTINGFVVTQDNGSPLSNCQLFFAGGVEVRGVEVLPSTPTFAAVKQQTGTFVLAPGFGVTFAGNFSAINGAIAADQLTFTGTAEGLVRGSVIGLRDITTRVGGNVDIFVDRSNADPNPAGFLKPFALIPQPETYQELTGP